MSSPSPTVEPSTPAPAEVGAGIVARGVRRTFRGAVAVDHVDVDVPAGRVTALVGPNGSGKTTLLLVLAGLLVPDAGTVRAAGVDVITDPVAARAHVGWMPDVHGTWDTLTASEVLRTVAAAYRLPKARAAARAEELLAMVHLEEYADAPAHVLSRGQKQRLGLARAIVHSPAVLLLDEPASGLDPRSRVELRDTLRSLAAGGAAVLVSSHVLAELDELADRAVFVTRGRVAVVHEDVQGAGGATGASPTGGSTPTDGSTGTRASSRRYRVRSLDAGALERALSDLGAARAPADQHRSAAVEVDLAGETAAAALLAALVSAGVPVTSFAPSSGALESAYLDLDDSYDTERR